MPVSNSLREIRGCKAKFGAPCLLKRVIEVTLSELGECVEPFTLFSARKNRSFTRELCA
jgi:hypothetical protein